jgi:hypothetical protein
MWNWDNIGSSFIQHFTTMHKNHPTSTHSNASVILHTTNYDMDVQEFIKNLPLMMAHNALCALA